MADGYDFIGKFGNDPIFKLSTHMNKNQELVTLIRDNGQRLRRTKEWIDRNQHWIKRMKLTVLDAPESIAAEIEKTLTDPPLQNNEGYLRVTAEMPPVITETDEVSKLQTNEPTIQHTNNVAGSNDPQKTETIEQVAEDVAAKIIPDMTVEIKGGVPVKAIVKSDVSTTGTIDVDKKLTKQEAATYGKMTYNKLTKLVRKGVIKTVAGKTPKAKMILASQIDNYLSTQKQAT